MLILQHSSVRLRTVAATFPLCQICEGTRRFIRARPAQMQAATTTTNPTKRGLDHQSPPGLSQSTLERLYIIMRLHDATIFGIFFRSRSIRRSASFPSLPSRAHTHTFPGDADRLHPLYNSHHSLPIPTLLSSIHLQTGVLGRA